MFVCALCTAWEHRSTLPPGSIIFARPCQTWCACMRSPLSAPHIVPVWQPRFAHQAAVPCPLCKNTHARATPTPARAHTRTREPRTSPCRAMWLYRMRPEKCTNFSRSWARFCHAHKCILCIQLHTRKLAHMHVHVRMDGQLHLCAAPHVMAFLSDSVCLVVVVSACVSCHPTVLLSVAPSVPKIARMQTVQLAPELSHPVSLEVNGVYTVQGMRARDGPIEVCT